MKRVLSTATAFFVFAFLVAGCATTLAPTYDKAISDGLTSANIALMELFATASGGTEKSTFPDREVTYNKLIGRLDALAIQARARPVPKSIVIEKINKVLSSRGVETLADNEAPSSEVLDKISATLTKMKETDSKQGITATEVAAFKGQVTIWLDQAITYESFLER